MCCKDTLLADRLDVADLCRRARRRSSPLLEQPDDEEGSVPLVQVEPSDVRMTETT
jgi:hypothetical protein